jgi:hypothetical protein
LAGLLTARLGVGFGMMTSRWSGRRVGLKTSALSGVGKVADHTILSALNS